MPKQLLICEKAVPVTVKQHGDVSIKTGTTAAPGTPSTSRPSSAVNIKVFIVADAEHSTAGITSLPSPENTIAYSAEAESNSEASSGTELTPLAKPVAEVQPYHANAEHPKRSLAKVSARMSNSLSSSTAVRMLCGRFYVALGCMSCPDRPRR